MISAEENHEIIQIKMTEILNKRKRIVAISNRNFNYIIDAFYLFGGFLVFSWARKEIKTIHYIL